MDFQFSILNFQFTKSQFSRTLSPALLLHRVAHILPYFIGRNNRNSLIVCFFGVPAEQTGAITPFPVDHRHKIVLLYSLAVHKLLIVLNQPETGKMNSEE